jgi:hypothetical protein
MRVRTAVLPLIAAAVCSLAAGCSSSGGSGSSSTPPTSAAAPMTSSAVAPPMSSSAGGGAAAANSAFCKDVAQVPAKVAALKAAVTNPAALKKQIQSAGGFVERLKAEAPADAQQAVDNVQTLFQQAQTAVANGKLNPAKLAALATKLPQVAAQLSAHCPNG